jgi:glycosyltransferase involved in cell wall biosynthesis
MITLIIPCYNYAHFLADALESVFVQSAPDLKLEVIVVDDGSTDETPQIAAHYGERIRYYRQENAGLSAARNIGMALAKHDLVLFLDADDALLPDALETLLKARTRAEPVPVVFASRSLPVDVKMRPLWQERPKTNSGIVSISGPDLVLRNRFAPAVLADRKVLLAIDGFDTQLKASEDRDLWIRVAARYMLAFLDQFTLLKRDHGSCMSRAAAH